MRIVVRAVHRTGLLVLLRPPHLADLDDGGEQPFGVAKRDRVAALQPGREGLAHVERHRHRPDRACREPHVAQHPFVLGRAHEPVERCEGAVQQELQIAELARGEVPALGVASPPPCFVECRLAEMPACELPCLRFPEHFHFQLRQPTPTSCRPGAAAANSAAGRVPVKGLPIALPAGLRPAVANPRCRVRRIVRQIPGAGQAPHCIRLHGLSHAPRRAANGWRRRTAIREQRPFDAPAISVFRRFRVSRALANATTAAAAAVKVDAAAPALEERGAEMAFQGADAVAGGGAVLLAGQQEALVAGGGFEEAQAVEPGQLEHGEGPEGAC